MPRHRACRSAKATSNGKKNRITADFPKKGRQASDGIPAKIRGAVGKSLFRSGTIYTDPFPLNPAIRQAKTNIKTTQRHYF